jgi:hypothetical protein
MKAIPLLMAALLLTGCLPKGVQVSDACAVVQTTLYPDGKFVFTAPEIDALREINQRKIVALKNWYRGNCL